MFKKGAFIFNVMFSILLSQVTITSPQELTFKNHGKVIKELSLEKLKKVIQSTTITVFEPTESENIRYNGFPVNNLLTGIYGDKWKETEEILFTCRDGYQKSIPSIEFKEYPSYLVYTNPDKVEFTLINRLQNNQLVDLGPFYLVWDNISHPELQDEGASNWPYQVTTIDLINFRDRFPNMAPPKNSPMNVKNGFLAFRQYCMACHTINGEGGEKSVELNYPVSVTEYFKESWLIKWIYNPRSVRFNTTMPALNPKLKDRETVIKDIIAYLKAMKDNKRKP
ncbi:MAG: c-type cytochrome [Candidatus Dadabacteria bacterium]|nr:c-type cytochrome [Candidatus Dadabacteria bacterium]